MWCDANAASLLCGHCRFAGFKGVGGILLRAGRAKMIIHAAATADYELLKSKSGCLD
jgi:hypothetical protein